MSNNDETVNVMNLHECTRTNTGHLALCIGTGKKTHANIERRGAFTLTLASREFMREVDCLGIVSGYKVPDKFSETGLNSVKSPHVDAPIIVGNPLVIECKLIEFVQTDNFTTVVVEIVNVAADESVLTAQGKIDAAQIGMLFYDSFSSSYFTLGERFGRRSRRNFS